MRFTLLNDHMCYNDAYLMTSRAVKLHEHGTDHGYQARKWEYIAVPGYRDDVIAYYTITRMDKNNYSELVGILWL